MSKKRVAINGFGRIGRLVLRSYLESGRDDLEFVAINDLAPPEMNAHLLEFDTVHGRYNGDLTVSDGTMNVGGHSIKFCSERNPEDLPWGDLNVDIVMECTGIFNSRDASARHLQGGAKRVLVSAPCTNADMTVVYGVNDQKLEAGHTVVSNASCTTNCLAPVAQALNNTVGIERGYMTTIHSYTGDQPTLDTFHSDFYRARGAASNLIPTSTGAARAVGLVLPEMQGKLDGAAIRVPTPNVSLVDLTFTAGRATDVEEINQIMVDAVPSLKGVLVINNKPLVSSDFNHSSASSTFDAGQTQVVDGTFVRVVSWYDNEWGFSNRMSDTAVEMGKFL